MYEFQTYALYESIVIVLHFDGTSPWRNTSIMLEQTKQESWSVAPSLSSSYVFELKFHHFYLDVGSPIIQRWNKLHNTIILQDDTFQDIL